MSNTIQNGAAIKVNLEVGESLKLNTITGTYTATIIAGAGAGTALATASDAGATYGPYASAIVVEIRCSADGLTDFEVGVTPTLDYVMDVGATIDPVTGGTSLSGGGLTAIEPRVQSNKALQRFRIALAGRNTSACDVLHVGTSISWGYKSGTAANRWASKLRDGLRARFPSSPAVVGGFGFVSVQDTFAPITLTDGFVTRVGGATVTDNFGIDTNGYSMTATGHKITFSFTGTGFDVLFAQFSGGGTFYYKVDGGANNNVSTNGTTNYGARNQAIRSLVAGAHTVEVGWVSGACYCTGGFVYNGDEAAGIRSTVAAWPSTQTSWWWNPAKNYWLESIQALQPALVIIELGANDYAGPTPIPVATFASNIQNIIVGIKSRCTIKPSFVLVATWPLVPIGVPVDTWTAYANALTTIANADPDGAVVVDNWMPRTSGVAGTTIGGILDADTAHPSVLGGQYIADAELSAIAP